MSQRTPHTSLLALAYILCIMQSWNHTSHCWHWRIYCVSCNLGTTHFTVGTGIYTVYHAVLKPHISLLALAYILVYHAILEPHSPLLGLAHCASCNLGTLLSAFCSGPCSTLLVQQRDSRTAPNKLRITTSASTYTGQRPPACTRLSLCLFTLQCMSMYACQHTSYVHTLV